MARRYETITELYHETIAGLAAPQVWQSFLTTACHNFRLPFDEQVLLFAQRPDATAVLPIDGKNGWNQRFGRWVNRGATGIAVFDGDAVGRSRLKFLLVLHQLIEISVKGSLRHIAEDFHLRIQVALPNDTAQPLGKVTGPPGTVKVMQGNQPILDIGASAHLLGAAHQDTHLAGTDL